MAPQAGSREFMPLSFLTALPEAPGSSVTLFHPEEVKGSSAGAGLGRRACVPLCMLGKLSCQAWVAGAVWASPAHLVALRVSEEPGGHEAPECFQNPSSCRPHLGQEA